MTTIAWDGAVLAGDTLACGRMFDRKVEKVFTIQPNVYFAGSGNWEDCIAVADWLKDTKKTKPPLEENFAGILIDDGVAYRLEYRLMKDRIKEKHHSVGSGASFAITAMYLGQGAVEAIHTAAIFDCNTSFDVTYINVKGIAAP